MAFPRLNAFSYWVFLLSGAFLYLAPITGQAPHAGWFNYVPFAGRIYSPGLGIDFYCISLVFLTISTTVGAVNFIVTILRHRANAQYLGVAFENRGFLLPTRDQLERAYGEDFSKTPRACMDGWARSYIHVTPAGKVLPCHAAEVIASLAFDGARDRSLAEIWESSPALAKFRGEAWMAEPCRSCDRRGIDHGGCRCQAFLLAGDAAATDPACALSPVHSLVRHRAG